MGNLFFEFLLGKKNKMNEALALKKLKGVKPKGVKIKEDSTKLGDLINLCDEFWSSELSYYSNTPAIFYDDSYIEYHEQKALNLISDIDFSESDLESFVYVKAGYQEENYKRYLGMFTGNLLTALTSKNKLINKRTAIYLTGNYEFPYLFSGAYEVDILVVNDFLGEYVCANMAGNLNMLLCLNLPGEGSFFQNSPKNLTHSFIGGYNIETSGLLDSLPKNRICCTIGENIEGRSVIRIPYFEGSMDKKLAFIKNCTDLIKSIPDKTYDEVIKTAFELEDLYKSTLPDFFR
mgnify:CR=1 FL=1|jgi:hypothetical protein